MARLVLFFMLPALLPQPVPMLDPGSYGLRVQVFAVPTAGSED